MFQFNHRQLNDAFSAACQLQKERVKSQAKNGKAEKEVLKWKSQMWCKGDKNNNFFFFNQESF